MKTQNLVIMAVVLIVILLGALYFARPVQAPSMPQVPSGAVTTNTDTASGQTTVTPAGLGFTVSDPYALATTEGQVMAKAVIPPCDAGFDYCIYRNGTEYAKTNFESAGIGITQRKDLPSQASCINTQPEGYNGLKPKTTSGNGYVIGAYSPIGGGAAGSTEGGVDYRLWYGSTCYDLRTRVAQAQFANYPAGTKIEFTSNDRAQVFGELQAILDSMTINGTPIDFPNA